MINPVVNPLLHRLHAYTKAFKMRLNRPCTRLKSIGLALGIAGGRVHMAAPVIEHPGNVTNLCGFLRTSENKVIILRPVKLLAKASHFSDKIAIHHKKMADIIHAGQQILIKIRLKMRVK